VSFIIKVYEIQSLRIVKIMGVGWWGRGVEYDLRLGSLLEKVVQGSPSHPHLPEILAVTPLKNPIVFKHINDIRFKGKRRSKTCHWFLLGAMGPAGVQTAPDPPHSSRGVGVDNFAE
jgi:hypothetical protein